jgi:hypothetical protein
VQCSCATSAYPKLSHSTYGLGSCLPAAGTPTVTWNVKTRRGLTLSWDNARPQAGRSSERFSGRWSPDGFLDASYESENL